VIDSLLESSLSCRVVIVDFVYRDCVAKHGGDARAEIASEDFAQSTQRTSRKRGDDRVLRDLSDLRARSFALSASDSSLDERRDAHYEDRQRLRYRTGRDSSMGRPSGFNGIPILIRSEAERRNFLAHRLWSLLER
jgi:hypothetical protein